MGHQEQQVLLLIVNNIEQQKRYSHQKRYSRLEGGCIYFLLR